MLLAAVGREVADMFGGGEEGISLVAALFLVSIPVSVCLFGLGSNIGERGAMLHRAVESLAAENGVQVLACSNFHTTRAVGGPVDQPDFLNAVIRCDTTLSAFELLDVLQRVENDLGRTAAVRWGPRKIDLDLLLFDEQVISSSRLVLPHPRMAFRRFVLAPACEVGGSMIHPPTNWSLRDLLDRLDSVRNYVAITGGPYAERSRISREAAELLGATLITDPLAQIAEKYFFRSAGELLPSRDESVRVRQAALKAVESADCGPANRFVLSDFWLGESLAITRDESGEASWSASSSAAEHVLPTLLGPKLLVLLEESSTVGGEEASHRETAFITSLRALAATPRQCPVLHVHSNGPLTPVEEIVAAVQAMR